MRKFLATLYDCDGDYMTCFVFESERGEVPQTVPDRMRKKGAYRAVVQDGARGYQTAEVVYQNGDYIVKGARE